MILNKAPFLLLLHPIPLLLLFCSFKTAANNDETASTEKKLIETLKLTDFVIKKSVKNSDYVLFQTGTKARLALDSWKSKNKDQMEVNFQEINEQEQQFLLVLDDAMRLAAGNDNKNLKDTHEISTHIERLVDEEKFWNSRPVVLKVSPAAIHFDDTQDMVSIKLHGANLNLENATIEINGEKFGAVETEPDSILFQLPTSLFSFDHNKSSILNAAFSAQVKTNWFTSLILEKEVFTVNLDLLLLPKKLGDYRINYLIHELKRKEYLKKDKIQFSHNTPGWSCEHFFFKADPQRKINIPSVKTTQKNAKEGKYRVVRITEEQITLELCAKRWSNLSKAQISTGSGIIDVDVEWKEYQTEKIRSLSQQKGQLIWGKDHTTKLPDSASNLKVQTTLFNGWKNAAVKSGVINEFLYLLYDPGQHYLSIKQSIPPELSIN